LSGMKLYPPPSVTGKTSLSMVNYTGFGKDGKPSECYQKDKEISLTL
jgi:hypothetical protein